MSEPDMARVLRALRDARSRLEAAERRVSEPVAIIGMACRFPGAADPEAFWELLRSGRDALSETPASRWDAAAWYDPDPETPGKLYTRRGGYLADIAGFDPAFFGISPREAVSLDPQQRLLLEVSWEALERAGVLPVAGSATGVFVGIGQNDYAQLAVYGREPTAIGPYDGSGNGFCFAVGRLSYWLGAQGPSLAVDTACSSSLVAVHLAVQSLRAGECALALAGGVHLSLLPQVGVFLARTGALAPDGRSKAFAADADGFGRGEGCGMVVLKRLSDALAAGDNVLAVIRGSAINHDGPSSGLTVPSERAQEQLLRQALANARLNPEDIAYIETHGTGTALGDPIEAGALASVFGNRSTPLPLGAVKTVIGHLEAAAGIAGLIKTVQVLQHGVVPPQPGFSAPNPRIPWAEMPLRVADRPWPLAGVPLRAGVSAFGMAGSNAHVVLEQAPPPAERPAAARRWQLLPLSARDPAALAALGERYRHWFAQSPTADLAAVAATAASGRRHYPQRRALVVASVADAAAALTTVTGQQAGLPPRITFLFSGQGTQQHGMGRELYQTEPVFRDTLDRCAAVLETELPRPLLDVLYGNNPDLIHQTAYAQPALFALGYALAALWRSWGVEPAAVMGHSVGELTAACVAGVFSLEDGLTLIAARGRLMQALPTGGGMVALLAPLEQVAAALAPYRAVASIAAVNAPAQVVIAGQREALAAIVAALPGVTARPLTVSHAFHSPLLEPMLADFRTVAAGIRYQPPVLPLIGNLHGAALTAVDAEYWVTHARQPVQFAAGIAAAATAGTEVFLEIGPGQALLALGRQNLAADRCGWLPSLERGGDDSRRLLDSLAALYERGLDPDWAGLHPDRPLRRVVLPTYPFQRQRYWLDVAPPRPRVAPVGQYALHWQTASLPPVTLATPGRWLLVEGDGDDAAALATALRVQGQTVVTVTAAELAGHLHAPLAGVVYLGALRGPEQDTVAALAAYQARVGATLLNLVQTLRQQPAPLWLLTRGAVLLAGDKPATAVPAAATLWGFGRCLALEQPDCWGGLIDLDPTGPTDAQVARVVQLLQRSGEDQWLLRAAGAYVPRLQALPPPAAALPTVRADAAYLISGGLGALGLSAARWLARHGARQLLLLGRSAPSPAAAAVIAALGGQGVQVRVLQADVADETAVRTALAAQPWPVRGIIHAAGLPGYRPLAELTVAELEAVLRPKVLGGWVLQRLGLELDFFLCLSSVAAVWGSARQAHYAAANQFLDALAHWRAAHGQPALSIAWGPWAGAGMATEQDRAALAATGVTALDPTAAWECAGALLATATVQAVAANVDWARFRELYELRGPRPLLAELGAATTAPAAITTATAAQAKVTALPTERAALLAHLQTELAAVLGWSDPRRIGPTQGFFELGLDSMTALELKNRLSRQCGRTLPATLAFDCPDLERLTDYLLRQLAPLPTPAVVTASAGTDSDSDTDIHDLDAALATRLARLDALTRPT